MTTYTVGEPLTGNSAFAPVGLVLHRIGTDTRVVRTDAGWIDTGQSYHDPTQDWSPQRYVVEHVPEWQPPTLARFAQRMVTTTVGAAVANSINLDHVRAALEAIGAMDIETPMSPGMWVHGADRTLLEALPEGTVMLIGNVNDYSTHSWWGRSGDRVAHLLGELRMVTHELLLVHSIPGMDGPLDWVTEPFDPATQTEFDAFKERAWDLGMKAKQSHQWCGQYEVAMGRLGLTREWRDRPRPMTIEAVKALEVGAVVAAYNANDPNQWGMWERVDDDSEWGLQHWLGPVEDDHPPAEFGMVAVGGGDTPVRVPHSSVLDGLPLGTRIAINGSMLTKLERGWSRRPMVSGGEMLSTNVLRDYGVPTIDRLGDGRYGLMQEYTAEQIEEAPDGSWFMWWRDGVRGIRIARRDRVNGDIDIIDTLGALSPGHSVTAQLVAEPGDDMVIVDYRILNALPVGSRVSEGAGRNEWTQHSVGRWRRSHGSSIDSHAFQGACGQGSVHLLSVAAPPAEGEGPRIGVALTSETCRLLPVGSTVLGTTSGATYTVIEDGVQRAGGLTRSWNNYTTALNEGRMIVQTMPDIPTVEAVTVSRSALEVGERLNQGQSAEDVDALPLGSLLFGMVSRDLYRRVEGGWQAVPDGVMQPSVTGLNPSRIIIHAIGDGDGGTARVSATAPSDYPVD